MNWNKDYSVGIHELDEQHKTLVECVATIEKALSGGDPRATVQSALARLASAAEMHFAVEESLMRIHDYPLLEEHASDHHRFSDRLLVLKELATEFDVSRDMLRVLNSWIENHIHKHDKPSAFHFLRRSALGVGEA